MTMRLLTPLALGIALASCQTSPQTETARTVDTHEAMVRWINPAALAIWDVGNNAMGDEGGLDPARMDEAAWTKLQQAAELLEVHSRHMADAHTLHVGAHNDAIEGFATRSEIQAMIEADPDGFRALSRETADHARELAAAARARDVEQTAGLTEALSERCQDCHSRYWEKTSG